MTLKDEISKGMEIQAETRKNAENFLMIEVDTSLTFAHAALSAGDDPEKKARDQANARKGYDTLLRFSREFSLVPPAAQEFAEKLRQLKSALEKLGEANL